MKKTIAPTETKPPLPPFTAETARIKVQQAEDAWNSRNPDRVSLAYSLDTQWRNRTTFLQGRQHVRTFLADKWEKELDYQLKKTLWSFTDNYISVKFEYEYRDANGQWFRAYGNELWEFAPDGLMQKREASINDQPINESDRRLNGATS